VKMQILDAIDRLEEGASGRCAPQRRSDTLLVIHTLLTDSRENKEKVKGVYEANANLSKRVREQDERIDGLRKALDDRNTMMDNAERESRRISEALSSDNLELWDENTYLREAVARQSIELSKALR